MPKSVITARFFQRLVKRFTSSINDARDIKIRDILILPYQEDRLSLFEPHLGEYDSNNEKIKNESETALINRMLRQISVMSDIAKEIHLKDNFDNNDENKDYQLRSDCKNNITRLSTCEYFFYPLKEHGPLSEEGFTQLIEKVDEQACHLPENLHLTLATFPVKDADNRVHNILVYVQCGMAPKINISAKAFPGQGDPAYPGTINPFSSLGNEGYAFTLDLDTYY